jgi:hypothetical protein
VVAGVAADILGGIATYGAARIAANATEDQLEANLILEAVKVCEHEQARTNLTALINAGFLDRHKTKINLGSFNKWLPPGDCQRPGPSAHQD